MRKILLDILILVIVVTTIMYVYSTYKESIIEHFFGEQPVTMYIGNTPIAVSVADDSAERTQGLSGMQSLGEFRGKLFVFPTEGWHGIWMKEMNFPLDIIWINNDQIIVHIEENVSPDTYDAKNPEMSQTFVSKEAARFVLEVNAFFVKNNALKVGDPVRIPASLLPSDLVSELLEIDGAQ